MNKSKPRPINYIKLIAKFLTLVAHRSASNKIIVNPLNSLHLCKLHDPANMPCIICNQIFRIFLYTYDCTLCNRRMCVAHYKKHLAANKIGRKKEHPITCTNYTLRDEFELSTVFGFPSVPKFIKHVKALALKSIEISGDYYNPEHIKGLLTNVPTLANFTFYRMDIGDDEAIEICNHLKSNVNLTSIDFSNNAVLTKGANAIAQLIAQSKTIRSLKLCSKKRSVGKIGLRPGAHYVKRYDGVNAIKCDGAISIADSLIKYNSLTTLYLANAGIDDVGMKHLIEVLLKYPTMKNLNLSGNAGLVKCIDMFIQYVGSNKTLCMLDISDNKITNKNITDICKGLAQNENMANLVLRNVGLKDEGISGILIWLKACKKVKTLDVSDNKINVNMKARFKDHNKPPNSIMG